MNLDVLPDERHPYDEGRKAIADHKLPSSCPYLPDSNNPGKDILGEPLNEQDAKLWLEGWSDAFLDGIDEARDMLTKELNDWENSN